MKSHHVKKSLRALGRDRSGNFAILGAVSGLALLLAGGTAVDITRAYSVHTDMSNALDAAVLATAKAVSVGDCKPNDAAAKTYLDKIMAANMANVTGGQSAAVTTKVELNQVTNTLTASATFPFKSSFGIFGDAGKFPISSDAAATFGDGTAEVAMTFDLTGSMRGSKIASLKSAATNGITTLLSANYDGNVRVRIAEIPYAAAVNVGPDLKKYVWPDDGEPDTVAPDYIPPDKQSGSTAENDSDGKGFGIGVNIGGGNLVSSGNSGGNVINANVGHGNGIGIGLNIGSNGHGRHNGNKHGNKHGNSGHDQDDESGQTAQAPDACATERKGPEQFSDAGPESGMINRDGDLAKNGCPDARIVPLTADSATLLNEINKFEANGNTGGHIGIQWAWYMLSNKWADYVPDGSAASPASDTKVHKYMIIMTDGEFNTVYSSYKPKDDKGNEVSATSSNDAMDLCSRIKADGIQIFAVGFNLNGRTATNTLKSCASPSAGGVKFFYNASGGSQLESIYQQIAASIQKLRLVS